MFIAFLRILVDIYMVVKCGQLRFQYVKDERESGWFELIAGAVIASLSIAHFGDSLHDEEAIFCTRCEKGGLRLGSRFAKPT